MGQEATQTLLIRESFALFEEFSAAAQGWELDFYQLSPAQEWFFLEQLVGTDALVSRAHFPSRFLQRGASTPGYRTVSLLASSDRSEAWRWCGETVTHNSLLAMPVGGEFESVSAPGFDSIHLALSIDKLERIAVERFATALYQLMPDGRCFCAHGGAPLAALRRPLEKVTTGAEGRVQRLALSPELEDELAFQVLACLEQDSARTPAASAEKRWKRRSCSLISGTWILRMSTGWWPISPGPGASGTWGRWRRITAPCSAS